MVSTKSCIINSQNTYEIYKNNIIGMLKDTYNNSMVDIKTISETNNLIEFSIDYESDYINSFSQDENKREKKDYRQYKEELEDMLFSSEMEWGFYSEFDEFVFEHVEDEHFMKAINEIYIQNYHNENILIKIINAISEVNYDKVFPFGQTVAIAAVSNKNLAVQQKAIEAFEKWHQESSIYILENLDIKEKWLKNYVSKIINNLKEERKYA